MCNYYFDEDQGIAYKVNPVAASILADTAQGGQKEILVHTDVKVTNLKKEKVRRTLSESYPLEKFNVEAAINSFKESILNRVVGEARPISEEEYLTWKVKLEA